MVKAGTIFTTHTPVPAGIDIFYPSLVEKYFEQFLKSAEMTKDELLSFGRRNPKDNSQPFNMALAVLRTTAYANGVSRLHGEVSRNMWHSVWSNVPLDETPIGHVTNGVHTRSWISYEMSELFMRYLGPAWLNKPADQTISERIDRIPDVELWRIHERRRERLVAFTRSRLAQQLARRGASKKETEAASETLNPEALTIGFARRFATYKRATLLLKDEQRLKKLLSNKERPVQFIFAGQAHPRDNEGKQLIRKLVHFASQEDVRKHFVFLENYDINAAKYIVEGVDVWLNNPRRLLEASGTSGMKVLPNGGLNLSVLDGWWGEGYEPDTGWSIGNGEEYNDPEYQDEVESKMLFHVLENEIVPLFYDIGSDGLPRHWTAKMKSSMKKLCSVFNTNRMVGEYTEKFYMKAYSNWKKLSSDNFVKAKELVKWKEFVKSQWGMVHIIKASVDNRESEVDDSLKITAVVYLGVLKKDDVKVQVYSGTLDNDQNIINKFTIDMECGDEVQEGLYKYEGVIPCRESGLFGYSVRIMPNHSDMSDQFGLEMMKWIDEGAVKPFVKEVESILKSE